MKKFIFRLKSSFDKMTIRRQENTGKYKATNVILMLLFPLFIITTSEIIQMKNPSNFVGFLFERPGVVLFSVILVSVIYAILILAFKKIYIATTAVGIALTTLSIVELFKFNTSGNHLILTDMKMAVNVGNLTKFAYIKITPQLVIMVLIVLAYLATVYWFNPVVKPGLKKRITSASVCVASLATMFLAPSVAMPVYSFFSIDTTDTSNVFKLNEKFTNNNLIAFLAQTTTEFLSKKVKQPEVYDSETVTALLEQADTSNGDFKKPNVIVIMSEAFADFRRFEDKIDVDSSVYESFDRIRSQGYSGQAVVPAFGAYTVRTEFELQFGLPVRSLNDPNMPQRLLLDRPQDTIPSYFKKLGYNTNYIHTFYRNFYSRARVFKNYGFDNLYFDDNMLIPTEYYRSYISDEVIFDQMEKMMKETDEPVYIHTTTMQNHQPYDSPDMTQLEYYFQGVEKMLGDLETFINNLNESGEPTVVLFVGDHFPCFKGEESVYNELGITGETAGSMYVQEYFIWNNFGMDYNEAPKDLVSTFYLPYVVLDLIDAPKSSFV